MSVMFAFNGVEASKKRILTVGDSYALAEVIERFVTAHNLDCSRIAEYQSEADSMLYELAFDPDTEYSYVTMYIDENADVQ